MDFEKELASLESLASSLRNTKDLVERQEILLTYPTVIAHLTQEQWISLLSFATDLSSKIALFSTVAIGQHEILFAYPNSSFPKEKIKILLSQLVGIDRFYDSIGGIVGYQVHVLRLLAKTPNNIALEARFSRAAGIDLATFSEEVQQAIWEGIRSLDEVAEIYPIGGLGSRLNLVNKSAAALPAACLPFGGRTLLEGLVRDVQAREFLYARLFNRQVTIPIAMMTSCEKDNTRRVRAICEKKRWFGRPKESFRIFSQISVPVVTQEGRWSMRAPLEINLQPGGHGALWKAAEEGGIFFWLQREEKCCLLIRQINNPIAGLDFGLLALMGIGKREKKIFGFASCERLPHAAEGVLVLVEEKDGSKRLSNIEYTDFRRYGIADWAEQPEGYSLYPANTNILYADLSQILPVIKKTPLPGLVLNMKKKEPFLCPAGRFQEVFGGRLESMMQNISDALVARPGEPLRTFLTYNARRRTISVTKKNFEVGKGLLETPEGAFYDLLHNAYDLLKACGVTLPPFNSEQDYLMQGPSLLFLYHPALGPLYSLIAQKIRRGDFALFSELQLEIADVLIDHLQLEGSLLIQAKNIMGHDSQGILCYSHCTGKCFLKNVQVINKGINRSATTDYWKNQSKRHQALRIFLQGHSELYAEGIVFRDAQTIVVPHGERWIAYQKKDGRVGFYVEQAGWKWEYQENRGSINLNFGLCDLGNTSRKST
jgi:UTP---glucose-1-phosphate uridylyltransferase